MINMKQTLKVLTFVLAAMAGFTSNATAEDTATNKAAGNSTAKPTVDSANPVTFADNRLSNGIISVTFDKEGTFSIHDAKSKEVLLSNARFGLPWGRRGVVEKIVAEDVRDVLGVGKRVILEVSDRNELRYKGAAKRLFTYVLYKDNPALVCGFGIRTPNYLSLRLMGARPLAGGRFFDGKTLKQPMTLNGSAGRIQTIVEEGLTRSSANSLMLTGLIEGKRRTAVWGGLGYKEFGAYAILQDGSPAFYSEDPVGRLIDEDQNYLAHDTFYLDVHTQEPFDALERYGLAMRRANNARPNVYDFPVLCG